MGNYSMIAIIFLYVFSFFIFTPQLNILPSWITNNQSLYILTFVLWQFGFVLAILKWGLR